MLYPFMSQSRETVRSGSQRKTSNSTVTQRAKCIFCIVWFIKTVIPQCPQTGKIAAICTTHKRPSFNKDRLFINPRSLLFLSVNYRKHVGVHSKYCSGQKTPDCSWGRLSEALGNWGSGNLEGGGFGERVGTGEVSLQATWDRGGRILSQLGGFQVSRRGLKGEQGETKGITKGISKGRKKARGMRHVYCNLCSCT